MKRRDVYNDIFSARALFFTGLIIMPALLFNPSTEYRCIQFLFFCFLVLLSGKKINFFVTILIIAGITAFNLIVPYGRVLFSAGAFKITSGALKAGIHRAVTLEALVMLSKVTIRQDVNIPGAFGKLLCESLRIFSAMTEKKYRITAGNVIAGIDALLLELSDEAIPEAASAKSRTKLSGFLILILAAALSWLPWLL